MSAPTKAATRWVVVLTVIGSLMAALNTLVVSTAVNTIRLDFGATVEQLEWTVSGYNLSFAVLLITGAALGDRYGRRLGVFAAASAAAALAPGIGTRIGLAPSGRRPASEPAPLVVVPALEAAA